MSAVFETSGPATLIGITGRTCSVMASLRISEVADFKEGRGTLAFKENSEGFHYTAAPSNLYFKNGSRAKIIIDTLDGMGGRFTTTGPVNGIAGVPV